MKKNIKDPEHAKCREYMEGKNCEFCELLFHDIINKEGFYHLIKNPPELISDEDIAESGYQKAFDEAKKEFIKPAEGFARCKVLCRKHQAMIRNDNNERNEKGIDIPTDFSLLRIKKSLL